MNEGVWPEYHLIKYLNQACVILFLYSLIIRAFVGVESVGFDSYFIWAGWMLLVSLGYISALLSVSTQERAKKYKKKAIVVNGLLATICVVGYFSIKALKEFNPEFGLGVYFALGTLIANPFLLLIMLKRNTPGSSGF